MLHLSLYMDAPVVSIRNETAIILTGHTSDIQSSNPDKVLRMPFLKNLKNWTELCEIHFSGFSYLRWQTKEDSDQSNLLDNGQQQFHDLQPLPYCMWTASKMQNHTHKHTSMHWEFGTIASTIPVWFACVFTGLMMECKVSVQWQTGVNSCRVRNKHPQTFLLVPE